MSKAKQRRVFNQSKKAKILVSKFAETLDPLSQDKLILQVTMLPDINFRKYLEKMMVLREAQKILENHFNQPELP